MSTVLTIWFIHSSSGFLPAIEEGSVMFSSAVKVGIKLKAWKTNPKESLLIFVNSLSLRLPRSTPFTKIDP